MPDSPFSEAFSEDHFYTQSSDKHHHNEKANFRCPGDWLHFASVVANSPLAPEYTSISDIMRDGFAKAIRIALDRVNDPDATAAWNLRLGTLELERLEARDQADMENVELWESRLRVGHGVEVSHFFRDMDAMFNPQAIHRMEMVARQYSLSR